MLGSVAVDGSLDGALDDFLLVLRDTSPHFKRRRANLREIKFFYNLLHWRLLFLRLQDWEIAIEQVRLSDMADSRECTDRAGWDTQSLFVARYSRLSYVKDGCKLPLTVAKLLPGLLPTFVYSFYSYHLLTRRL
nr:MAG TPA: hypothetical protein [Caudoviricetes sp.]